MKTSFFSLVILFVLITTGYAQSVSDDCPCRRKRIVERPVVAKKVVVKKVKVEKRYSLFPEFPIPDEILCKGKARERQNFKVRIMPNPVNSYINVIYDSENGQKVRIELLSCEGKLIKTLMNKVVYGEGLKASTFDINGQVKRGDAYIRLTSGVITKVEKIFVL
ncbi:MAG: hypothetical protein M0P58_10200 [Bacteroidales bacterium]|jgi:hypothetical protein|nr:hypothetical protein [Bacteroidales bacterium]